MKIILSACMFFINCTCLQAQTWDEWFKQKKTQRKYMLQQIAKLQLYIGYIKAGYRIANNGLGIIGEIKSGDFNLHNLFISDKQKAKHIIRYYSKVQAIYKGAETIKNISATAHHFINRGNLFTAKERSYLEAQRLTMSEILDQDIEDLNAVLTNGNLQMSDDERLQRINRIHNSVVEKRDWIQNYLQQLKLLHTQRKFLLDNNTILKGYYGF